MNIPLQEQPAFSCGACGKCCSHIRGMVPDEEKEFIKQYAFGKLPVVQVVPMDRMTFPLWDWEAKRFRVWQDEKKINAHITPLRAILDLQSNKAIILTYFMDGETDACPFLSDNKCSIYNTKRAYVCRLFPFNKTPISNEQGDPTNLFGSCGTLEKLLPALPQDKDEMLKYLQHLFPNGEFLNALQHDLIAEWTNKIILELVKARVIRPAINYPYDFLLKRFQNAQHVDFTDFLTQSNHFSQSEMGAILERFDDNKDAEEYLKER